MKDKGIEPKEYSQFSAPEQAPETATNMEVALFYMEHITRPCEVEVAPGQVENIREFYIRLAKGYIPKMTNAFAKKC
ncbi:MAG: hypothetical protein WC052_02070 [Patescibacteria group bacterium]|jgi:hypothetical protein